MLDGAHLTPSPAYLHIPCASLLVVLKRFYIKFVLQVGDCECGGCWCVYLPPLTLVSQPLISLLPLLQH